MNISVIGLGYIGLPTAALVASKGINVIGVDIDQKTVNEVNLGNTKIVEPGLSELINLAKKAGKITTQFPEKADIFIIAVPTPLQHNKKPDTSFIFSACKSIAPVLEKGNSIMLESTSPVGTTEKIIEWLSLMRTDLVFPIFGSDNEVDISIAYCPERVLPGQIIKELTMNDRIMGGVTNKCAQKMKKLYEKFVNANFFLTDCRTAELCKLVENSFRDVNIAFANELSIICDKLQIDVWKLIKLAKLSS